MKPTKTPSRSVRVKCADKPVTEKIFLITDGCVWEKNKKDGTSFPHSIEVVDVENGQVRYIRGGSRVMFVDGAITPGRSQEVYNKQPSLPRKRGS